eukprot:1236498-Karenia_brevis.AAC.1
MELLLGEPTVHNMAHMAAIPSSRINGHLLYAQDLMEPVKQQRYIFDPIGIVLRAPSLGIVNIKSWPR